MVGGWLEPIKSQQTVVERKDRFIPLLAKPVFKDCIQPEWRARQRYVIEFHARYCGHDLTSEVNLPK